MRAGKTKKPRPISCSRASAAASPPRDLPPPLTEKTENREMGQAGGPPSSRFVLQAEAKPEAKPRARPVTSLLGLASRREQQRGGGAESEPGPRSSWPGQPEAEAKPGSSPPAPHYTAMMCVNRTPRCDI